MQRNQTIDTLANRIHDRSSRPESQNPPRD